MSGYDFHIIRSIGVRSDGIIVVQFSTGVFKEYDIRNVISSYPQFGELLKKRELFRHVRVDDTGTGIIWNDIVDLDSGEIWNNGKSVESPFCGMVSFADAAAMWHLEGSTLRRAVTYGKLVPGRDCAKFGKQWVVTYDAMIREYGQLKEKGSCSYDEYESENKAAEQAAEDLES